GAPALGSPHRGDHGSQGPVRLDAPVAVPAGGRTSPLPGAHQRAPQRALTSRLLAPAAASRAQHPGSQPRRERATRDPGNDASAAPGLAGGSPGGSSPLG